MREEKSFAVNLTQCLPKILLLIYRKRNKWATKITWQKVTCRLGSYECIEEAIDARQEVTEQGCKKELCV